MQIDLRGHIMKQRWHEMMEKWGSLVLGACFVIVFYLILSNLGTVWSGIKVVIRIFLPVIIGACIAYVLNPFAVFYWKKLFGKIKKRNLAWYLSVALTVIVLLVVLALLLYSLIPEIIKSVSTFVDNFDNYLASLQSYLDSIHAPDSDLIASLKNLISNEGDLLGRALNLLMNNIGNIIKGSTNFTAGTANSVIGFITAIYFLADKERVIAWLQRVIQLVTKNRHYDNATIVGQRFNSIFTKYIFCELIDAAIVGVVNYIFMLITGMPYAIMVSAFVAITNLVPTFGPIVGAAIGILILLLTNPINALWFLIFTIILQTIDGYIIKPKLFGDVLNVPGIVILIAIIVFGRLFGIVGIFIAIPLAAIIIYILQQFIFPRMEKRKAIREAEQR